MEGRMQFEISRRTYNHGGVLSPHGGPQNRYRHDTSYCIQLGVRLLSLSFLFPLTFYRLNVFES